MIEKDEVVSPTHVSIERSKGQHMSIQSHELMQGRSQIEIIHKDEVYLLRITRQDKLILTK